MQKSYSFSKISQNSDDDGDIFGDKLWQCVGCSASNEIFFKEKFKFYCACCKKYLCESCWNEKQCPSYWMDYFGYSHIYGYESFFPHN